MMMPPEGPGPRTAPQTRLMESRLAQIEGLLVDLEDQIPQCHLRSTTVSKWSVGQQVEHVLKATSAFAVLLLRNRSAGRSGLQNPLKDTVLQKGSFPRGLVQAPDVTQPSENPSEASLHDLLRKTRNRVGRLEHSDRDSVAHHPYLGDMSCDEVVEFLAIHLRHHLSIIREIVKAPE